MQLPIFRYATIPCPEHCCSLATPASVASPRDTPLLGTPLGGWKHFTTKALPLPTKVGSLRAGSENNL
jgi:hypothetical protein